MWLLRQELCAVHEYEADEAVLDSGINAKQYQILLIKKAAGGKWYSIANSFNHSKLKYRITMMSRKKSSGWTMVKALYVLPIAAFAAIAFANCSKTESESTQNFTYDQELFNQLPKDKRVKFIGYDQDGQECVLVKEIDGTVRMLMNKEMVQHDDIIQVIIPKDKKEIPEDKIFMIVEEMPEYPGGEEELRKFITENVQYPEDAKANRKEGKVFVQFIIDNNGDVKDVEVVRGIDCESINNEAIRLVKSMPQWKPGKQRGQYVPVSYVVPVNFKLD
jgi:TonB family protein